MAETIILSVIPERAGERIDKYIADSRTELSRSYIQKLIKDGQLQVNNHLPKANYKVNTGDVITLEVPEPETPEILPENIPLDILYEDEDVIVINKGKDMVVHPAAGHYSGTIVNALLYHCKDSLSGINGVLRPGIVHRIDKDTTGIIVACKNDTAHNELAKQFKEHTIIRKYYAIVYNGFREKEGTVEGSIGRHPIDRKKMAINAPNGKPAVTHYRVLDSLNGKYSYIACTLETGRTHQIRVHMTHIGHPLLGDAVYGPSKSKFQLQGQTLHAGLLGFCHPTTGEYMEFTAPLPDYFQKLLKILKK